MTSKLDEEIAGAKQAVMTVAGEFRENIDASAPRGLVRLISEIVNDGRTPWFMLGMAVEALGITIQLMLGSYAVPVLDFVVGGACALGLMYWQGRRGDDE